MANTIVKIQGLTDISWPFATSNVADVKANLQADYPQIGQMNHTQRTADNGDIIHSFTQKDGTKN